MSPSAHDMLLAAAAGVLSWSLVGLYAWSMRRSRRLDPPNARSMHSVPVPVGAGIAIVLTVLLLWGLPQAPLARSHMVMLAGFTGLGALSWIDDHRALSPAARLAAQGVAVAVCLALLPPETRVLPALPLPVERLGLGLAWLWFINLFNFMDGIDGLAGSEAMAVALGYLLLAALAGLAPTLAQLALILAAATTGYLLWNWHPAKVFMGDAGSVPLGFMLGWLLLDLAFAGHWAAAAILPLYFVADATHTLVKRATRGEKPWHAHREHFYQRAVLGGTTPAAVVWRVGTANVALIALAVLSLAYPLPALTGAALVVAGLLGHLGALGRSRPS
jgi:UDP-N-acetylmuramyl pentapeptide phosphotransferase/UDP-N-acetylglucosamine-1-phosphate transferase